MLTIDKRFMRKDFLYGWFVAVLMLALAAVGVHTNTDHGSVLLSGPEKQLASFNDLGSEPLPADYHISNAEATFGHLLNRMQSSSRIITSVSGTATHNSFHRLNLALSQVICRRLHAVKTLFTIHYSQKAKDGYYIYVLRKLLI